MQKNRLLILKENQIKNFFVNPVSNVCCGPILVKSLTIFFATESHKLPVLLFGLFVLVFIIFFQITYLVVKFTN